MKYAGYNEPGKEGKSHNKFFFVHIAELPLPSTRHVPLISVNAKYSIYCG
jgi:hypothetical protein